MDMRKYGMVMASCAAALLCATQVLATQSQPAGATASKGDAKSADRLLTEMKVDAQRIQSHAMELEKLSKDPNAKWAQFDQQWNEIKPAQEALQTRVWRLESMRALLSDSQRKALDDSKQAAQEISARTSELLKLMDQPNPDLKSAKFRSYAQALAKDAETVARSWTAGA
jgi:hypothetical protein